MDPFLLTLSFCLFIKQLKVLGRTLAPRKLLHTIKIFSVKSLGLTKKYRRLVSIFHGGSRSSRPEATLNLSNKYMSISIFFICILIILRRSPSKIQQGATKSIRKTRLGTNKETNKRFTTVQKQTIF